MQENSEKNSDMKFEDFESMIEESFNPPSKGSIIKGSVVAINDTDVLVNIGSKSEATISKSEFEKDGILSVKIGDEVEAVVEGVAGAGGYVRLSRKILEHEKDFKEILIKFENNTPINVKIESFNDKGFLGKSGEVQVFIPINHIESKRKQNEPKTYLGKTVLCKILKVDTKSKSVLASHKIYSAESSEHARAEIFNKIQVGDKIKGIVKTVKDYGVFINIGNIDGFLHRDNIEWGKVKHPSKYFEPNDSVEVIVLNVDKENKKIELGLKQLKEDPWNAASEKYPVGSDVKGTIITKRRRGYVIEVEPGIDGFIPDEETSWVKNSRVKLEKGDIAEGRVIDIDNEHKKIVLSLKLLQENPWNILKKEHPEGSVVTGKVKTVTDFGVFVDFGAHSDGLIRKSDISWKEEPADLNDMFKIGDEVTAKILLIDEEKGKISLGIKQLEKNPWKDIDKLFPAGKVVDVEVSKVNKDSVEVVLTKDIKGVIPAKELDENKVIPEDFCKVGDKLTAVVLRVDKREKEIQLSIKKYKLDSEKKEVKEYLKSIKSESEASFSLGEFFKEKIDESK